MELNEFNQKLMEESPELKKAYSSLLLQQLRLQELSAKTNYVNLKMQQNKTKEEKKPLVAEKF